MVDIKAELNTLQHILEDIQAAELKIIDVHDHTSVTDYMVICTGRSSRHVRSIAEYVMEHMKQAGYPSQGNTGIENGEWALVDFGDIIVHIFQPSTRDFYNLDGLWHEQSNP